MRFTRFWWPRQAAVSCPALMWSSSETRYQCGLVSQPRTFWRWLPSAVHPVWQRMLFRWIAAGVGCDSSASIETDKTP
ncbi:hypothetical protein [Leeia oryzae]|uniref:hypothetical protein n=1 Tax=Leeia oryzae TaxID=356662 RepID=UPI001B7FE378|nr:hypothetical protein [Leeia oryzae]